MPTFSNPYGAIPSSPTLAPRNLYSPSSSTYAPDVVGPSTTPPLSTTTTSPTSTTPSSTANTTGGSYGDILNSLTYGSTSVTKPPAPTAPTSPASPLYNSAFGNMYMNTFTNPNSMWDEYNQGQGVNFTQGAARAMAKAGRTGMLPTLNTMAHQDYMSNYLPSVRKDLAPGLGYENTWNQNLTQKYGQDQDFASKNYGTDASMYGQGLTYASNMAQVAAQVKDIGVKESLGMLDADLKMYGIDNDTIQQIYSTMGQIFPKMTAADQAAMVDEMYLALQINKAGNVGLADITNPVGTTPAPAPAATTPTPSLYENWSNTYGG